MSGDHNHTNDKSWAVRLGGRISAVVSDLFAHPYMQIGVILFCVTWFALRLPTDLLTAALSILAITLTQMVLNRQNEREVDDHRRDVAMHAKLDEMLIAMKGARDEMAGIEDLDEEDIVELKDHATATIDAIDAAGEAAGSEDEREAAKRAVEAAAHDAKVKSTPTVGRG
ncbi:MAG: low affinity iron permease family protein [Sphingomicrobium sp.]